MIHVFIGTKAQYIKTAPVILELEKRGIAYNLIDSGQHSGIAYTYRRFFRLREPDAAMRAGKDDIKTFFTAFSWLCKFFLLGIFFPKRMWRDLFKGKGGICIIHGDTPTTLLSIFLAKRAGLLVAHLESGLRSHNIFHPFPEEIIRIITMYCADYLFVPGNSYAENLKKMGCKGALIQIGQNTNVDSIRYALQHYMPAGKKGTSYQVLMSIHRFETIYSRKRLAFVVELISRIPRDKKILFCIHPPTEVRLRKYKLFSLLQAQPNLFLSPLLEYPDFVFHQSQVEYIITDGGSIQEESYYLGIPCLVLRKRTERYEGIGENVCLSGFNLGKVEWFIRNYGQLKRESRVGMGVSPSAIIVEKIDELA